MVQDWDEQNFVAFVLQRYILDQFLFVKTPQYYFQFVRPATLQIVVFILIQGPDDTCRLWVLEFFVLSRPV